jgi:hypothetical protein
MPRRPAMLTQADIARVIRAAKAEGACTLEVRPGGVILIRLDPQPSVVPASIEASLEDEREIIL